MRRSGAAYLLLLGISLLFASCGGAGAQPGIPFDPGTRPELPGSGDTPWNPPSDPGEGEPTPPSLSGGVLFTVDCQGEVFRWWATNPQTSQALIDVYHGSKTVISFGGTLVGGQGDDNHNAPWSWHVHPENNGVDVLTVPESPATPSQCENQLGYWLSLGVTFIPWNGVVTGYQDLR